MNVKHKCNKEITMEDNKYENVLKGIVEIIRNAEHSDIGFASICTYIGDHCPELESEDEKARKQLLDFVHRNALASYSDRDKWVAYLEKVKDFDKQLEEAYKTADEVQYNRGYRAAMEEMEKQDKQTADCPQNHQDVNHPNGCITMEDFSGGEGFYKLNIEYLNKRQVEEIEEIVRTWNNESKISNEVIKNCIGMCLTDVCEQRFKDYNTSLKDCLAWLEKQGKQEWTEGDIKMIDILCCIFEVSNTYYKVDRQGQYAISSKEILNWLNNIKQRLQ